MVNTFFEFRSLHLLRLAKACQRRWEVFITAEPNKFGIKYYKVEPTTFVVTTGNGKTTKKGEGLSFFYNSATISIAAISMNAQEARSIFNLQAADF